MHQSLFVLCFLLLTNLAFAEVITTQTPYYNPNFQTQHPNHYRHYNHPHYNNYVHQLSKSDLAALEKFALNRTYSRESDLSRLERLEDLAFGSVQTGNIISRYKNVENAILSRPQNNYNKKTLLNTIGNYFAGQATGFTPNIYGSNYNQNFFPSYNNNRFDQYSSGMFGNSAFRTMDNSFGNGAGLRILY